MPPTASVSPLAGVIPYVFTKNPDTGELEPVSNKHVYLDLPTDEVLRFFHFKSDDTGKLTSVPDPFAAAEAPMWLSAVTEALLVFHAASPLAALTWLTRDLCEKVSLQKRDVGGVTQYYLELTPRPQYLNIRLQNSKRETLTWAATLVVDGHTIPTQRGPDGVISTIDTIPVTASEGYLDVQVPVHFSFSTRTERVKLFIGKLDRLVAGDKGIKTAQKILTNLGYYTGQLTGKLDAATAAALSALQGALGIKGEDGTLGPLTTKALVREQGSEMVASKDAAAPPASSRNQPLASWASGGWAYLQKLAASLVPMPITSFDEFRDPADHDPATSVAPPKATPLEEFRHFPKTAFVAPSDIGAPGSPIRVPLRRCVFMDTGRWIGGARDFGLTWGRHVYLCSYNPKGKPLDGGSRAGLDIDFLKGMKGTVTVQKWACVDWVPETDFDWEKVHIVIPDLHLLTGDVGTVWFQKEYDLQAELDLLSFTKAILDLPALKGKLQVVQLGDSYDLWVAKPFELFVPNANLGVHLADHPAGGGAEESKKQLVAWIQEIQGNAPSTAKSANKKVSWVKGVLSWRASRGEGDMAAYEADLKVGGADFENWLNPAEKAMRLLQEGLGAELTYLHGNHDCYLIRPDVTSAAGLLPRKPFYEAKHYMVEHGHRMEAYFAVKDFGAPRNFDGEKTGFDATVKCYNGILAGGSKIKLWFGQKEKEIADKYAEVHDQPSYEYEYAKLWLGRHAVGKRQAPHIFAIGHTHDPKLIYVDIDTVGGA